MRAADWAVVLHWREAVVRSAHKAGIGLNSLG
jgi:hypothetical protein